MKKVFLYGPNAGHLEEPLKQAGLQPVTDPADAELVLVYGGDGSMLSAVRMFPEHLIFAMRDGETAPLCPHHTVASQLEQLAADKLKIAELPRLCGFANGKKLFGVNDIFIHNKINVSAMRYNVWIDSECYGREIVGDGVGVSTVHGSTAYYRSITHSVFRTGIGLAFSNSTELVNHLVLPETARIKVKILRGPCEMVSDNSPETVPLSAGDEAIIALCTQKTPILGLDIFMCPVCRQMRHDLRRTRLRATPEEGGEA